MESINGRKERVKKEKKEKRSVRRMVKERKEGNGEETDLKDLIKKK